jgi:hypothetical protein
MRCGARLMALPREPLVQKTIGTRWGAPRARDGRCKPSKLPAIPQMGRGGIQKYGTWSFLCRGGAEVKIFYDFSRFFNDLTGKNRGIWAFLEVFRGQNRSGSVRSRKSTISFTGFFSYRWNYRRILLVSRYFAEAQKERSSPAYAWKRLSFNRLRDFPRSFG